MSSETSVVLTIAGSDCSAGAGIQADLKTFHSLGVYGLSAVSGVVAESPSKVISWKAMDEALLRDQLECLFESFPISVVKTGLLFSAPLVEVVSSVLVKYGKVLVIDPVGAASAGASFGGEGFRRAIAEKLFPLASLVTPNLIEARQFLGADYDEKELGSLLFEKYSIPFLVKGGHSADKEQSLDVLVDAYGVRDFVLPRLQVPDFHGTGCTLSAAIAAYLARGETLEGAIRGGKAFLYSAMKSGLLWERGDGSVTHALNVFPLNS